MTKLQKRMALLAGASLLIMALVAGPINFGIIEKFIVPSDAALTATNFNENTQAIGMAVLGFSFVILLDIIVAWSLYYVLRPINESLAKLMAVLRIVGATIFAASLTHLWQAAEVSRLLNASNPDAVLVHAQTFLTGWSIGLGYFGVHLLLIAVLMLKGKLSKIISGLLLLAGAGYIADMAIVVLAPTSEFRISTFTFIGELLFMVWLFVKAKRG